MKSTGSIFVLRPGYLTRRIEEPEPSKLTITPRELRMVDRDGTEVLDLRQNDEVRVFVTSIMRVFLGDRKSLERSYTIEYTPDAKNETGWTLSLLPGGKPLNQMLRSLELRGEGSRVTRIEILEPNGDKTITTIVKADPKRKFTPEEKHELFGIRDEASAR